jgi:hypothetical protein
MNAVMSDPPFWLLIYPARQEAAIDSQDVPIDETRAFGGEEDRRAN